MKTTTMALMAVAALGTSSAAIADEWYIAPAVGLVFSDIDDIDTGPSLYLSAGRQLEEKWNLELSAAYSELDTKTDGKYARKALNVSGLYFPLGRDETFTPFALASLGAASVDFANTSNYAPVIELGAGVLKNTSNSAVTLRGELRYRMDIHRGKDEYNNDVFYEWTALIGAQLALGSDDPMPTTAADAPLVLPAVTFPLDSAQLTRNARVTLDEVAAVLLAHPDISVDISGHADDTGPSDYNYTLSVKRADAVTNYLVEAGVPNDQLHFRGIGEGRPVASNTSDDGRMRNRRVEFHVN